MFFEEYISWIELTQDLQTQPCFTEYAVPNNMINSTYLFVMPLPFGWKNMANINQYK